MNLICTTIQATLAECGPQALQGDPQALEHVSGCEDCFSVLEGQACLDVGLRALSQFDAPDHVVDALLARPELATPVRPARSQVATAVNRRWSARRLVRALHRRRFGWASGLAASLALVTVLHLELRQDGWPEAALTSRKQVLDGAAGAAREGNEIAVSGQFEERERGDADADTGTLDTITVTGSRLRDLDEVDAIPIATPADDAPMPAPPPRLPPAARRAPPPPPAAPMPAQLAPRYESYSVAEPPPPPPASPAPVLLDSPAPAEMTPSPEVGAFLAAPEPAPMAVPGNDVDLAKTEATLGPEAQSAAARLIAGKPIALGDASANQLPATAGAASGGKDHVHPAELGQDGDGQRRNEQRLLDENRASQPTFRAGEQAIGEPAKERQETDKQPASTPLPRRSVLAAQQPDEGASASLPQVIEQGRVPAHYPAAARSAGIEATVQLQLTLRADGVVTAVSVLDCDQPGLGFEAAAVDAVAQWRYQPRAAGSADLQFPVTVRFAPVDDADRADAIPRDDRQGSHSADPERAAALAAADAFLHEREQTDGLEFQPASGYWSNSYIPGDPAMRLLQAKLADAAIQTHAHARPAVQPFDPPESAALAVYLHADRRGIDRPGRMLVQVGLQGSARQGGRRPAMNLALVLDLSGPIDAESGSSLRALLEALNRAREPGDRFRVLVAGRDGANTIEPTEFRHGVLQVAMDRWLDRPMAADPANEVGQAAPPAAAGAADKQATPRRDLPQALAAAIQAIAAADDPTSPLGSSAVLLLTARSLGGVADELAELAHQSALAGMPVSVIGIGTQVDLGELDALALAGQGSRRLLDSAAQAGAVIDRELSASSRVVARAVRLRIRLAPGVRLVDVIGSERLDERRAQQVRDAEQSIDLRLSRNLGIEADRGEDEEGIQIVIPSFYANDAQVILLDVVVPGPGPVADVTARYKDLVQLRNGVGRASLALGHRTGVVGPLERNVLKNLLSRRLSSALESAGSALAAGDPQQAGALLEASRQLLLGLRLRRSGLDKDADLANDLAMLSEYAQRLDEAAANSQWLTLAASLRYAALLKVLPPPLEIRS